MIWPVIARKKVSTIYSCDLVVLVQDHLMPKYFFIFVASSSTLLMSNVYITHLNNHHALAELLFINMYETKHLLIAPAKNSDAYFEQPN